MKRVLINPLWMVHVIGPDDVHPAPDFDTAVQWCAEQNAFFGPISAAGGITLKFVPALWNGTPEEHAAGLPASIEKWTENEKPKGQKCEQLPCIYRNSNLYRFLESINLSDLGLYEDEIAVALAKDQKAAATKLGVAVTALERIRLGDTMVFDEELECDVVVRMDMDEIQDIAEQALTHIKGAAS